jgi:hypothetical protein
MHACAQHFFRCSTFHQLFAGGPLSELAIDSLGFNKLERILNIEMR